MKASEDQSKIQQLLKESGNDDKAGGGLYYNFEAFDPKILSSCYGIKLNKTFEDLLLSDEIRRGDFLLTDGNNSQLVPVLPDEYFDRIEPHLRPQKDAKSHLRYDMAVKLLIRDCAKQQFSG